MMKCREVSHVVATDAVGELGFFKRLELRLHVLMCNHCRRYLEQIRGLGRGARDLADRDPCPGERLEEIEGKILDRVRDGDDE